MPEYRRYRGPGGSYFFTVVTNERKPIFNQEIARQVLRQSIADTRVHFPFQIWASVLLHDHLHCIWILPDDDDDYSKRWSMIKRKFSQRYLSIASMKYGVSTSRRRHREFGVWQRRFWEHSIRSEEELYAYRDYIHLNPVKHGYVEDPNEWPWSSVHRHLRLGWIDPAWTGATPIRIDPRGEV